MGQLLPNSHRLKIWTRSLKNIPNFTTPFEMCEIRKFHHKKCGQFISRVFAHTADCQRVDCSWIEIDLSVDRVCPWCDRTLHNTFSETHSRLGEISGGGEAGTCQMTMKRYACCGSSYDCIVSHKPGCTQQECVWTFLDQSVDDVVCPECKEMAAMLEHFGRKGD